jgi:hypothetical protein
VQEGNDHEGDDVRDSVRPGRDFLTVTHQAEGPLDAGIDDLGERDDADGAQAQGNQRNRRAEVRAISEPTKNALPTISMTIRNSFPISTQSIPQSSYTQGRFVADPAP